MAFMDDPETAGMLFTHLEHMNMDLKFHSAKLERPDIDHEMKMWKKTADKKRVSGSLSKMISLEWCFFFVLNGQLPKGRKVGIPLENLPHI